MDSRFYSLDWTELNGWIIVTIAHHHHHQHDYPHMDGLWVGFKFVIISSAQVVYSFVLCPAINANWSCDTLLFIVVCWTDCHTDMHSSNSINSFYKSSRRNSRAAAAVELSCLSILSCPAQEVKKEQSNRFLQLIASLDST